MNIRAARDAGRIEADFGAADAGMADRQRDEAVVLERVVVEEIPGAGAEVGDVERPAANLRSSAMAGAGNNVRRSLGPPN